MSRVSTVTTVCCVPLGDEDIPSYIRGETLEDGRARVDSFRAVSSSVYICLTSEDPILTSFYLISRADKLAFDDPIFKVNIFYRNSLAMNSE